MKNGFNFLKLSLVQTKEVLVEEIKPLAISTPSPKPKKKEKTPVESSTTTSKESSLDVPEIKKPPTYALIVKEEKVSTPSESSLEIPKRTPPKYKLLDKKAESGSSSFSESPLDVK